MKKFVCPVCGYVHEANEMPADFKCPLCKVPGSKFKVMEEGKLAAEHEFGIYEKTVANNPDISAEDKEFIKEQQEALRIQLELADRLDLPVIIHSRESTELIINVLKECRHLNLRGVFHAYSGSIETYRQIERLGDWYIGIGGVLTYKKASIAGTVRDIPLDRILLETDCPYLTPVPFRGKRNESSYIPHIAARLAEILGKGIEEIAETTTANAEKLFRI